VGLDWVTPLYKSGAAVCRTLPRPVAETLASTSYAAVSRLSVDRRLLVRRNLTRASDGRLRGAALDRAISATFKSYGQYWVDSFRLMKLSAAHVDAEFSFTGVGHLIDAAARGTGMINVLPHLGGWEWAAFWVARVLEIEVNAVVEAVEPPELFDFFTEYRKSLGVNVIPLGPGAAHDLLRAIRRGKMVCLLADRDIEGTGVDVEFFGERTTLPAGPAILALRTGAPLLPTAVYFRPGGDHLGVVRPPIPVERCSKHLRDDVDRITQDVAHALESLIREAPEQWHLQQPNWPSDWDALEAIGHPHARPTPRV
jgi:lauroyl/myristoyl acyltransferase